MKIAFYSAQPYDTELFIKENDGYDYDIRFYEGHLNYKTSNLAKDCEVVCAFANDDLSRGVLQHLHELGVKLVALRCAGFNNVDLCAASEFDIKVVRVPAYSPNAVAEHTIALILALNRNIHKAYNRTREANFTIDGLMGFDLHGKTVGLIGLGKIGSIVADILKSFGCNILVYDPYIKETQNEYSFVSLTKLLKESDIVTLHCPLTPETHHLIDDKAIGFMKQGVMLINTSRGATVDSKALIKGLKSGHIGYLGLDVYEEEADVFFEDLSNLVIHDDTLSRLLTFPNVVITAHQAFFTQEAMDQITSTTLANIYDFENGNQLKNQVRPSSSAVCMT